MEKYRKYIVIKIRPAWYEELKILNQAYFYKTALGWDFYRKKRKSMIGKYKCKIERNKQLILL